MMKYDLCKKVKKFEFHSPILGVRDVENYSDTFLDVSGRQWDNYFGLNRTGRQFSVLEFFVKNSNLVIDVWRSLEVLSTRVSFALMYGMIRVRIQSQRIKELMERILIFMAKYFPIFFMQTWFQSCPIIKILSKSDYTQNLEIISCTKRFKKLGFVFFTYLI